MAAEFDVSEWVADMVNHYTAQHGKSVGAIDSDLEQLVTATIHCVLDSLADPACPGSEEVIKAIMRKREAR